MEVSVEEDVKRVAQLLNGLVVVSGQYSEVEQINFKVRLGNKAVHITVEDDEE